MSVNLNVYTVYGIKIEPNEYLEEALEGENSDLFIYDGMSGEFVIAGVVLYASKNVYNDIDDSFSSQFSLDKIEKLGEEYKVKFRKAFPEYEQLMEKELKVFTFFLYT